MPTSTKSPALIGPTPAAAVLGGDVARSPKSRQDFLALRGEADADLPVLTVAKKEYERLK